MLCIYCCPVWISHSRRNIGWSQVDPWADTLVEARDIQYVHKTSWRDAKQRGRQKVVKFTRYSMRPKSHQCKCRNIIIGILLCLFVQIMALWLCWTSTEHGDVLITRRLVDIQVSHKETFVSCMGMDSHYKYIACPTYQ
jgi:hypothetical protein